jgi:hypothetical protein
MLINASVSRLAAVLSLVVVVLGVGCGSSETEASAAPGPAAASEGGDVTTEGTADVPSEETRGDSRGATNDGTGGTAAGCDEATLSLVGHFSLTRYPGQAAVGPNGERPIGMSKEYEFTRNSYTMEGYPPLRITGRYEVLERDGLRRRVRFYDTVFDGSPQSERELWVVFADCGAVLQMDGMTYARRPDA